MFSFFSKKKNKKRIEKIYSDKFINVKLYKIIKFNVKIYKKL